ncbi:GGDEF domain-containing protein [Rhodanobacter sp. Si-c]|uniref:diguanylate cyclase n=1 Tax=Rhodanobacter lycopersici TaxID=3162487 RepID=A0ABV3QKM1_9GAMM
MNTDLPLSLIGPIISMIFGVSFFIVCCHISESRRYLWLVALAFFGFGLAATLQVLLIPQDIGKNIILSAALYTLGAQSLCEGLLQRSGQRLGSFTHILTAGFIMVVIYIFYYIDRSLIVRIFILNFGFGALFLMVAIRLRSLRHGRSIDRLVWWVVLVFSLHFFPRTLVTVKLHASTRAAFAQSPYWITFQVTMALFVAILAFVLLTAALVDVIDALKVDRDHDALTDLLNRRGFERQAKELLHQNAGDDSINLVVCDIDHFKAINDRYGHPVGDSILKEFARLLQNSLRSIDIVGRIGGEEFVALLPDCDKEAVFFLVERLRRQLQKKRYQYLPADHEVTASFGVAGRLLKEGLWDWFARADIALYSAKTSGRNRVFLHDRVAGILDRTPEHHE